MRIIKRIDEMRTVCDEIKNSKTIGFVPTMGALHEGHLKLIAVAKEKTDFVVASIFVNPLQFGESEDFRIYPKNPEKDAQLLETRGVDLLFIPDTREMYTDDYNTYVEVPELSNVLCGKSRPGHFKGVCTIVCKLFNIIQPNIAVFGEKDAQQSIIIKRMVKDLNMNIEILTVPTVREKDGLAMSSRNIYLSTTEREEATILYQALLVAKRLIENGERDSDKIKAQIHILIASKPSAKIDYIEIVRKSNLTPLKTIRDEILIAVAVWFGKTRLIDNITLYT